jgi:hypothetical protein
VGQAFRSAGKKNTTRLFGSHFYTKNDQFTKTGSGQTWEKLRKRERRFGLEASVGSTNGTSSVATNQGPANGAVRKLLVALNTRAFSISN